MIKHKKIKWGIGLGILLLSISIWSMSLQANIEGYTVYGKNESGEFVPWLMVDNSQEEKDYKEVYYETLLQQELVEAREVGQGTYSIYSTIDLKLQEKLDKMFGDFTVFANTRQIEVMEAVMVVLNDKNEVVAMSSRGEHQNNPYLRTYSVGSTIKPLAIYSLAVEENEVHYSTLMMDEPSRIREEGRNVLWPQNNKGIRYGLITIEEALRRSLNTIPVQLGLAMTPEKSYRLLKEKLGVSTLTPNDQSLSALCLGEFEKGLLLQELVGAFDIFVNDGKHTEPRYYSTIEDKKGRIITETLVEPVEVIGSETATVMNRLLSQVVQEEGGTGALARMENMPVIGKTGTSDQGKDYLFVGVTPYYKSVLWLGYPYPESKSPRYNYNVTQIWRTIMEEIHRGLEPKAFTLDTQVIEEDYCIETGFLATTKCINKGRGYYKTEYVPTQCTKHN